LGVAVIDFPPSYDDSFFRGREARASQLLEVVCLFEIEHSIQDLASRYADSSRERGTTLAKEVR
jgi:hypothetical protein